MVDIKFKRLDHGVGLPMPEYKSEGASGMDICSGLTVTLPPGGGTLIPTGFAVEVPKGYELQCRSRSGMARQGVFVTNSPGTIDSDYRGEIAVLLSNLDTRRTFEIHRGDRIAQLVLCPVEHGKPVEVKELTPTKRGEGGFGSTGS
jgi:dUTP pyrophosphatase